jgi:hypothetical protein
MHKHHTVPSHAWKDQPHEKLQHNQYFDWRSQRLRRARVERGMEESEI